MPHVVLVIFQSFASPPLTLTVGVLALEEMALTRDDTYYYADEGECVVLQVQNVLFRVSPFDIGVIALFLWFIRSTNSF